MIFPHFYDTLKPKCIPLNQDTLISHPFLRYSSVRLPLNRKQQIKNFCPLPLSSLHKSTERRNSSFLAQFQFCLLISASLPPKILSKLSAWAYIIHSIKKASESQLLTLLTHTCIRIELLIPAAHSIWQKLSPTPVFMDGSDRTLVFRWAYTTSCLIILWENVGQVSKCMCRMLAWTARQWNVYMLK